MPRPAEEAGQLDALLRTNPGKWHLSIHLLHESSFVAHDAQRITLIHKKISQHLSNRSGFGASGIGIGWFAQREVVFLTFLDLSSDVWDIWKAMLAPSKKKVLASCQGCFTDSRHQQTSIQTYFWHVAFFWADCHPSVLEAPLEKNQRLAIARHPKLQNPSRRSVLGLIFTSKPISEVGKLDKFSHLFSLILALIFHIQKKKPLIFEN